MKKILSVFFVVASALGLSMQLHAQDKIPQKFTEGMVYVHTSRNAPIYVRSGKTMKLEADALLPANGLEIVCAKNQVITLIFSNRFALYIKGPAEFKIEKFEQVFDDRMSILDTKENTPSKIELGINSGEYYAASPTPRATSKLIIKTQCGTFEPKSESFRLSCSSNEAKLSVMEGQAMFIGMDGKTDFIQQKETGFVEKAQTEQMYPLKIDTLSMSVEENYKAEISLCRLALSSVEFKIDPLGKISAERLTPKEFLIKRTKYDYRR